MKGQRKEEVRLGKGKAGQRQGREKARQSKEKGRLKGGERDGRTEVGVCFENVIKTQGGNNIMHVLGTTGRRGRQAYRSR